MGYRIGLILGTKATDYPRMLRQGVQNTLEEAGHTLVCLADLVPYHTHANVECAFRVIFELAQRMDLNAVIVPVGTTSGFLDNDPKLANKLLRLLDPHKTLVMERDVEGYRSMTKDSRAGMTSCIRYLIEQAHYQRIAFVSGSAQSQSAREREGAYFDQMRMHGLDVPEGYFVRGDYSGKCLDVVEKLVDENPDIEAIACASDQIAFVVYDVMRKRRLEVGRDIAVTGFDDHHDSEHLDPPLATVSMSGYDFGCMAAREAIRLCSGLPQLESVQTGSFLARESCGIRTTDNLSRQVELLSTRPFPTDEVVSRLLKPSFKLAGAELTRRFRAHLEVFVTETIELFEKHRTRPEDDDVLFSSLSLAEFFSREYRDYFSLEGFHAAVLELLRALVLIHPEQNMWLTEQSSLLHLHVARLLDENIREEALRNHLREWNTLHLTEDALREDANPQEAYRLTLSDLTRIGVRWAELFLVSNTVETLGASSLSLTNTLWHVGGLREGATHVHPATPVAMHELLSYALGLHTNTRVCSVGGILAGDELMGVLVMDGGTLDDNGQMIAMINMGLALKHLQTMASIREMNEVLSRNNLQLARQSQCDEMTGLLNRRGFNDGILATMRHNVGGTAALLYLDMDGLKYINDTFGHDVGDTAIRAITRVLRESLPSECLLARMGGDEFVAFMVVRDESEAQTLVSAVKRGLESANASRDAQTMPYQLALSSGVACFAIGNDYETDFACALMEADERMYEAKLRHRKSSSYRGRAEA